jgi:hypothetical protein
MEDIGKTVMHSSVQLALGIVVGGLCDAAFPTAPEQKELDAPGLAWLSAEVILQIIANGLITAGVVKGLDKLDSSMSDPTGAMAYSFAIQASQPQLWHKLKLLGRHVTATVSSYEQAAISETSPWPGQPLSAKNKLKQKNVA